MWKKYWIVGLLACTAGLFGKINSVEAQGKAVVEDEEEVVLPPDSPAVDPVPVEKETDATKVQGPAGEPAGKKTPKNPNGAENSPNKAPSTPAKTVPDDSLTAKSKLARPREEDSAEVVVTGTKTK
ncbi:hypothetical protein KKC22_04085, partial [Myxococcota bacterium]|nr:hypothetical protein [Myxococcota bacterium]